VAEPPAAAQTPVAILCGGRGTRLQEHTHAIPKALVEIGGKPILWHVVRIYASQGFRRFLLLTGYLGEQLAAFARAEPWPEPIEIEALDTGVETSTGGRVARAADRLDVGTFCLTYADGVADIDLEAELAFHAGRSAAVTMTVVRPRIQWGVAVLDDDDRVTAFREKPQLEQWVNGGFFVCEPRFLDDLDPDAPLEVVALERASLRGELAGYRHDGFWDCMDTYKDATTLNDLWTSGRAPWRVWERASVEATS
jgi:glucose-1-phosphate cytidylyltransferase